MRAAQGWRGRARAGAAGARRPRLHNKAPAPVTSHRPGPADGRGTRAQQPLPLPSPRGRRRAGAGSGPGSLRALRAPCAPAIRKPARTAWAGWCRGPEPGWASRRSWAPSPSVRSRATARTCPKDPVAACVLICATGRGSASPAWMAWGVWWGGAGTGFGAGVRSRVGLCPGQAWVVRVAPACRHSGVLSGAQRVVSVWLWADTQSCFPPPVSRPDPRLPEPWRQPAPFSARPGSPAVPGLAGVGAEASLTPARSGPACPVHLDKLQLTGA